MKVKELKEILENLDDELDVFAFEKEVESWGIKRVEYLNKFSRQFYLSNFKNGGGIVV